MNRVLDRLWIGDTRAASLPLGTLGFVALLDLRDEQPTSRDDGTFVHWLGNRDGDPWKTEDVIGALDFIHNNVGRVLVACNAGMSRSASMVIGYLVRCGWDPAAALAHLRNVRREVLPKASMMKAVLAVVQG